MSNAISDIYRREWRSGEDIIADACDGLVLDAMKSLTHAFRRGALATGLSTARHNDDVVRCALVRLNSMKGVRAEVVVREDGDERSYVDGLRVEYKP